MPEHKMYVTQVDEFQSRGTTTRVRLTGMSDDGQLSQVVVARGDPADSECLCDHAGTAIMFCDDEKVSALLDSFRRNPDKRKVYVTCSKTAELTFP